MTESTGKKPEVDPARAMSANHKPAAPGQVPVERPKVEPLAGVTAKKLKPALGVRIRNAFTNDSAQSVGDYLLFEVAIPAIKATLFDLIQNGASRTLWGSGAPGRPQVQRGSRIDYNQITRSQTVGIGGVVQPQQVAPRNAGSFDGIIFPTRSEAEQALTAMIETIEKYNVFAVSDLYELVNIRGSWADDNIGWFELTGADIVPVRGGFVLDLPPVQKLR